MNPLRRLGRFQLVGAMGMVVQLSALQLLHLWLRGQDLIACVVALELTLAHNFLWHLHYTWRDRRAVVTPLRAFLRFQLSNGLISLFGNAVLTPLLVARTHLPLLAANVGAIACCSLANFALGSAFHFAPERRRRIAALFSKAPPGSLKSFLDAA